MEQQTKAIKKVGGGGGAGAVMGNGRGEASSTTPSTTRPAASLQSNGKRPGAATAAAASAPNGRTVQAPRSAREVRVPIGNVYQPECPAQRALETIASKWAILILHSLLDGPQRFNALQRKLPGISQKVLTEQLRRLERFGIVSRAVHPTVPPSVEYSLTPAGHELKGALGALCEWSNKHAALLLAGEASDAQARSAAKTRKLNRDV